MGHIRVWVCACNRCMHTWLSTGEELPNRCAKCKSTHWDREVRAGIVEQPVKQLEAIEEFVDALPPVQPIAVQSRTDKVPIARKKESKRPVAKGKGLERCKHGLFILDGVSACRECKK